MNYFFTFLLQTLLPISLLLGAAWAKSRDLYLKGIIWGSLLAFFVGVTLRLNSPGTQTFNLGFTIFLLATFILFGTSQCFNARKLAYFWQFLLMLIAGNLWAKDPNIGTFTNIDVINTDFILHASTVIFGIIFCGFLSAWIYFLFQQSEKTHKKFIARFKSLIALLLVCLIIPIIGELMLSLMKLQLIELTKPRLSFVAKSGEITGYLNYICAALILLFIGLFYGSIHRARIQAVAQAGNPIEKRQKLAAALISRRLIRWGALAAVIIATNQLYWEQIASRPPQLSEAQPVTLDEEQNVHIPIEQVKDGKLHRFVWIADDGKAVRFFIINRQPAKISLAAVFDACLLCGDQGYVMQDNQVVCVGCGVHMFIPSIGKPGGCNPVPIENWQQTENDVVINRASLEDGLNLFSTIVEINVQDPISGAKLKNIETEHKYSYENHTYFFENEKNLELFRDNPEKYLGNLKKQGE